MFSIHLAEIETLLILNHYSNVFSLHLVEIEALLILNHYSNVFSLHPVWDMCEAFGLEELLFKS